MAGVVRIRLALHGPIHNKIFHLVATTARNGRDRAPIETLGVFDPRLKPGEKHKTVEWSVDRIGYWLHKGAIPTKAATKLLVMVRSAT